MYHVYVYHAGENKLPRHEFSTYKALFEFLTFLCPATNRPSHLYIDSEDEYINHDEITQLLYTPLIFWIQICDGIQFFTSCCNEFTKKYFARILRTEYLQYQSMVVR